MATAARLGLGRGVGGCQRLAGGLDGVGGEDVLASRAPRPPAPPPRPPARDVTMRRCSVARGSERA